MELRCLKRSEQKEEDTWRIEDIYAKEEEWREEYQNIKEMIKQLSSIKGRLGESAEILFDYLELHCNISKLFERVMVYANQKYHEDTSNSFYQNLVDMASSLEVEIMNAEAFAEPEILMLPEETLHLFIEEKQELRVYKRYLFEMMRRKKHTLSEELESVLAQTTEITKAPETIFSMFHNADAKFPSIQDENGKEIKVTHGTYAVLIRSNHRETRKKAFQSLYSVYETYKNTLASIYTTNVKKNIFYAKVRHYNSSMEMALEEGNIPCSVYTNLLDAVHESLPSLHRYMALRKKALGVEKLHMYDLYTPIVEEVTISASYEKAKEFVYEGVAALGEEYQAILKEGFENRWIDVYENEGKRSGAYSWGPYGTHPYVLLNYQEDISEIFTLAHEMGHAIHSYYSDRTQPYIYAGYRIFVAEVASTCNEALLMHDMLKKTTDKKMKAYLLNYYLEQFRTTLYRQAMFAEFEMVTHTMVEEGNSLTADSLCDIYAKLNQDYFGKDVEVDHEIRFEWSRIPHFYYESFYVYQYATGYSAAIALSQKILKEGKKAVDDYIHKFLCGGSSKDPIDLLKDAGVDMSQKAPVQEALRVFDELLTELEELLQ